MSCADSISPSAPLHSPDYGSYRIPVPGIPQSGLPLLPSNNPFRFFVWFGRAFAFLFSVKRGDGAPAVRYPEYIFPRRGDSDDRLVARHSGPPFDRVLDLLEHWQSLERQGQTVSTADVCTDCPELTAALERLARFSRRLETLAADASPGSTVALACLPTLTPPDAEATAAHLTAAEERYTIEDKLGQGGMGAVYRARDRLLGRIVALKVIRSDAMSPALRARFEAEARAVARLDHPHIVKVFDVGEGPMPDEPAPVPFLTLEFVEGGSLAKRLGRETLAPTEAARLVALLARAMQHAHERGIVHRDLKPDNVLLAPASSVARRIPPWAVRKLPTSAWPARSPPTSA